MIEDDHTVARHCTRKDFADPEACTELALSVFEPKEQKPNISVNWLEYYAGDHQELLVLVRKDIASHRKVRPKHKLALIYAGQVRDIGRNQNYDLDIIHDPIAENQSHSLVIGIPFRKQILYQELADAASKRLIDAIA